MKHIKKLFVLVLLLGIGFLVGCQTNSPKEDNDEENKVPPVTENPNEKEELKTKYPVKIKVYDVAGVEVEQTFTKAPSRVITNNLSVTEILIELGLKDKIIGIMQPDNKVTSNYAEAVTSLKVLGDKKTLSKEVVLAQDPDMIIGRTAMMGATLMGTIQEFNELEVPVYTQKASANLKEQSLDYIIEDIKNIGIIFDVQEKANEYATLLTEKLNTIKEALKDTSSLEKKNALIMVAFNGGTFGSFKSALHQAAFELLGYTNQASGTSGLSLENLIQMDPEFILYVTSDRNKTVDEKAMGLLKAEETIAEVKAIKNDKVLEIEYDFFMDYGAQVIFAVEEIYKFLYK